MKSVICTLFESHYHFGVGALANSLYKQGYKGDIYAGYFGSLPKWANIEHTEAYGDLNLERFVVNEHLRIIFVPLKTEYHLANYRPIFMQWLLDGPARDAENIFCFDSDIIVGYKWSFFEEWTSYGISVCEDVNSPLPLTHPRRLQWAKYFESFDMLLKFHDNAYVNSGFIGINRRDKEFISTWIMVQEKIASAIGGLGMSPFPGKGYFGEEHHELYAPFNRSDQDALNVTIGTWNGVVSIVGKEGMAINAGPVLMYHALGPKPWRIKFLRQSFFGIGPRSVDKKYWKCVTHPIRLFSDIRIFQKNLAIKLTALVSRFYKKN